ncbi:chaplin family protein [Streptomyces hilarionis]|uniref:chaplin family protein n=1 Tax=Streptomyces hilarionis TaxID=2839954 RepID=UPI00211A8900|nr:chaplin family protein [Streptomyces hilarionis]MCQ9130415.1 chaplin [Streptomyces hilarionis]
MRRVTRTEVLALAAVSGAMAVTLPAHADSAADGSAVGSPGLISGNGVQLPVHLPVDLCGNTVNVVGVLNPAAGTTCADAGAAAHGAHRAPSGGSAAHGGHRASSGGGATAHGVAAGSPGVVSGDGIELPAHLPVNVSGNSVDVVGVADPAFGNESVNASGEEPAQPAEPASRPPVRHDPPSQLRHPGPRAVPPALASRAVAPVASLARTGADAAVPALAGSTALMLGGALLYRRFRPRTER